MIKDAVATMGMILPDDAGGRDAVHVAVFSAVSFDILLPGSKLVLVSYNECGDSRVEEALVDRGTLAYTIAIVDPFLTKPIKSGQRFWAYLLPRTITALKHQWSHPAFGDVSTAYATPSNKLASEQWLRAFCESHDMPPYEPTISFFLSAHETGKWDQSDDYPDNYGGFSLERDSIISHGRDAHCELPLEFWDHVETVIGGKVPHRPAYFSCSC
jgi:hypothetical protein